MEMLDRKKLYHQAVKWAGCRYQLSLALGIKRQGLYVWKTGVPERHIPFLLAQMQMPWIPSGAIKPSLRRKIK